MRKEGSLMEARGGAVARRGYRVLATGLRSPEGPVVLPGGDYAVVESMASRLARITPDGEVSVLAVTGDGPNGMAADAAGNLLVANNGGMGHPVKRPGSLQRVSPDGVVSTLAGDLDAPNDVCVTADGSVCFTDPRDNWFEEELRPGRVYRCHEGALEVIHEGLDYPNGIGVDPQGRLVVAESRSGWLHVIVDGVAHRWAHCPEGAPDGFCWDTEGRLYVCCFDAQSINVIEPDGAVSDTLRTEDGTWPTNCAIAPDGSLLVTESRQGRLLAFPLGLRALLR
jgi:gluconolactonase